MNLFYKTLIFITSKWSLSMDEYDLYPLGEYILYIPNLIYNILTQIFSFALFPLIYFYFYLEYKTEPLFTLTKMYVLGNFLKKSDNGQ